MSTDIVTFSDDQIGLIKRMICKDSTDDELQLFLHHCKRTGLDPFSRQIHAVKRWSKADNRMAMTIQTGIDGLRLVAERTGKYAGNDDPIYDVEGKSHPGKATVTVWKIVGGERVPFTRSARWAEFVQTDKNGDPTNFWRRMPYLMLGKCAEALALRAAFPQELAGLYTSEEMGQADNEEPVRQLPAPKPQQAIPQSKPPVKAIAPVVIAKDPEASISVDSALSLWANCKTIEEGKVIRSKLEKENELGSYTAEEWADIVSESKKAFVRLTAKPLAATPVQEEVTVDDIPW